MILRVLSLSMKAWEAKGLRTFFDLVLMHDSVAMDEGTISRRPDYSRTPWKKGLKNGC